MPGWYEDAGTQIIKTMIINATMPVVSLGTAFFLPYGKQAWDRGFSGDVNRT